MDLLVSQLIAAVHQKARPFVLALTGGGTTAAARLLSVPGGSRTVLEVIVPYHEQANREFLGHTPEQACCAAASQSMAARAFARARWLEPGQAVLGIGGTASLASDRPKKGDHRF